MRQRKSWGGKGRGRSIYIKGNTCTWYCTICTFYRSHYLARRNKHSVLFLPTQEFFCIHHLRPRHSPRSRRALTLAVSQLYSLYRQREQLPSDLPVELADSVDTYGLWQTIPLQELYPPALSQPVRVGLYAVSPESLWLKILLPPVHACRGKDVSYIHTSISPPIHAKITTLAI